MSCLPAGVCFDSRTQDVMDVHNRGRSRESRHKRTHKEGQIASIDVNWIAPNRILCLPSATNVSVERKWRDKRKRDGVHEVPQG